MRYKIDGEDETKVFIIYPTDMRQDGWFIVPLYHFTSQHITADLQFEFEYRDADLLVAGIEFQPSEDKVRMDGSLLHYICLLSMVMLFIKEEKKKMTLN